ncbi:MAG: hypothetical protein JSW53_03410, partial [Candidatus Bathyarchaeota archaeon]
MLKDSSFLELLCSTAMCYVPDELLDEDQLDRYDNIHYRWCDCRLCRESIKIGDRLFRQQAMGHSNNQTLEICLSRPVYRRFRDDSYPMFLLEMIGTVIHEIVHII